MDLESSLRTQAITIAPGEGASLDEAQIEAVAIASLYPPGKGKTWREVQLDPVFGGLVDARDIAVPDSEDQEIVVRLVVGGECGFNESFGKNVERGSDFD